MTQQAEYYTPNPSEFYIGFECEFKNVIEDKDGNPKVIHDWQKEICDQDLLSIAFDTYEHEEYEGEFADTFRIKCLDSNDLKELGWEFYKKNGNDCDVFWIYSNGKLEYGWRAWYWYASKELQIDELETEIDSGEQIYNGECYNKSELKFLMERLGIQYKWIDKDEFDNSNITTRFI